jgi:hypothetical protein
MNDLAEFLLTRIAEDGAVADRWPEEVEPGTWVDDRGHPIWAPRSRVLAECEAKRRIVERYRHEADVTARTPASGLKTPQEARSGALGEACLLLALPYADHPDYRPEWRP